MSIQRALFSAEITWRALQHKGSRRNTTDVGAKPTDLFLCLVDHFEPQCGKPPTQLAHERMQDWLERYPQISSRHHDSEGEVPQHSFFYPYDEYDSWEFARLIELCAAGFGEIDLHLHHKDDTSASLREKLRTAIQLYHEQGALPVWPDGRPAWGFIHGNWALDNSRNEDGHNFCGVNDELTLLAELGCYADFTFPAWGHTAQPRQLNSIFYATDDPNRPKSYDTGTTVQAGKPGSGTLMLIQGPLAPFWKTSRLGPRVAMDDGDMASYRRYSPARLDRWVQAGIHVQGRPDRIFIKLHTHGAPEANRSALLDHDLDALFSDAEARYNDGVKYRLHYVTAREMFNVVKATEAGAPVEISQARDWLIPAPPFTLGS